MKQDKQLTQPDIVKALAHPLRVSILNRLEDRTASPNQIAVELGQPLGNVSYHVRTLAKLGLIRLVSRKQRRGAIEHFYRAEARPVISDQTWADVPEYVKNAMVTAGLAPTLAAVQAAAHNGGFNNTEAHFSRTTFDVDEQAWKAVSEELATVFGRIRQLAADTESRLAAGEDVEVRKVTAALMLFEDSQPDHTALPGAGTAADRRSTRVPERATAKA